MSVIEKVRAYVGVYAPADVRALLHEDHEAIKAFAEDMAGDGATQKRVTAFNGLKALLIPHARAEEATVYTPLVELKGSAKARQMANEGFVEHSIVDVLVERLSKTSLAGTDAWKAHAKVLKESLDHHIGEEEDELFAQLGEQFDDAHRLRMGEAFTSRKGELLSRNNHSQTGSRRSK